MKMYTVTAIEFVDDVSAVARIETAGFRECVARGDKIIYVRSEDVPVMQSVLDNIENNRGK